MSESQQKEYNRHMRKAVEDHDMRQVGMAAEHASFEARIAVLRGQYEDAGLWVQREMWADSCAEAVMEETISDEVHND